MASGRISLGTIYRHLRDGRGTDGAVRAIIDFDRSSTSSAGTAGYDRTGRLDVRRGFHAKLDYKDEDLFRAELVSRGMSERALAKLWLILESDRYVYSVDGEHYGMLIDTPVLFDVISFQSRLDRIPISAITVDDSVQATGERRYRAEVVLAPEDFRRLLAIFQADFETGEEELESCSLVIVAAREVVMRCAWSLRGTEQVAGPSGSTQTFALRSRCRLAVSVQQLDELLVDPVVIDPAMPTLANLDDVWVLARQRQWEPSASAAEGAAV